ncbi:hypothetical protein DSECCO2_521880 [anaerobic digester metagenome]
MCKSFVRNNSAETEFTIQNPSKHIGSEQCWVKLNGSVKLLFLNQIQPDFLNLIRRTAMHGAQRDIVGNAGRNIQLVNIRIIFSYNINF